MLSDRAKKSEGEGVITDVKEDGSEERWANVVRGTAKGSGRSFKC